MAADETPEIILRRASQLRQAGRVVEAIAAYEELLALRPDLPDSWYNLAYLQRRARRYEEALASYAEALARGVSEPEQVHLNRAVILADHLARPDEAEAELEAALTRHPCYVPALLNLGNLHEDRGSRAEARAAYERALAAEPDNRLALARLAGLADVSDASDPLIGQLRQAIARPDATDADRADLGFALGRALDAAGIHDQAFAAYADANRASRASFGAGFSGYDAEAAEQFVDRLIAAYPRRTVTPRGGGQPPIFICGMFRSGSTLAEQIIGRHSRVTPGGELDLLPTLIAQELSTYPEEVVTNPIQAGQLAAAYLERLRALHPGADLVTDKRPDNFLHIGLIKTMFPGARIVHTLRNPLDNILSIWFLHLDPGFAYALDLTDAAHWYRQYRRLMAHWRALYPEDIFDLDYDALVADPVPAIRSMLDFLGLAWEEDCLSFHAATNMVKTASAWQVREPFYRRSSGRWRHYERYLAGLIDQLE